MLLGNFLLVHELFVTHQIVLRLHVVGFGLVELALAAVVLILGHGDSGARVLHVCLGGGNLAIGIHGGDGHIDIQGLRSGLGIGQRGVGLIERDLIIARINFGEHRAGLTY